MKHSPRVLTIRSAEDARREIARVGATTISCDWMAQKASIRTVRLENVPGKAANILKQEALAVGGDCAVSHHVAGFDPAPRPCVLLATERQYERLLRKLATQGFGLAEIGRDLALTLRRYDAPLLPLALRERELAIGARTLVMGIINVTPDSFSGDGLGADADAALRQAEQFAAAGADILDIGGESTRPGSLGVSAADELSRVLPCVERICAAVEIPVSIDTSKPEVARAALAAGAAIINDVNGLRAPGMIEAAAESGAPAVIMHMLGAPRDMQVAPAYDDAVTEVYGFLVERTEAAIAGGVAEGQIVIDPGLGFGKTAQHNLELVRRLDELRSLGRPILIGPSRKATIGRVLGKPPEERLWGTAALVALGITNGATIVRVHDVEQMAQVARMTDAVVRGWDEDAAH
jgi:dihydropteroate synthase